MGSRNRFALLGSYMGCLKSDQLWAGLFFPQRMLLRGSMGDGELVIPLSNDRRKPECWGWIQSPKRCLALSEIPWVSEGLHKMPSDMK